MPTHQSHRPVWLCPMEVDSNRERGGAITGWSHQPTMVELHSSGVLKDIDRFGGERGNVLGDPLTGHFRK